MLKNFVSGNHFGVYAQPQKQKKYFNQSQQEEKLSRKNAYKVALFRDKNMWYVQCKDITVQFTVHWHTVSE